MRVIIGLGEHRVSDESGARTQCFNSNFKVSAMEETDKAMPFLHVGLTGLQLGENRIDLGRGIALQGADATFMSPLVLVNTNEQSMRIPGGIGADGLPPLPQPAFWQFGGERKVVTAELVIPATINARFSQQLGVAKFIVAVLRLWTNPAIGMHAMSPSSFSTLLDAGQNKRWVHALETIPRYIGLGLVDDGSIIESLLWVRSNWEAAYRLYVSSSEFRLAADALDSAQFLHNEALALVSLWAAMEALFSPSTSELKFRVSSLIASYIEEPGAKRVALQKRVAALYDKRSAAAHGKPKHQKEDLVATFELLRRILIKMIHCKCVPSKEQLELSLFGA